MRKGLFERSPFLTFPHEKTTFQWPKVVSGAIFSTNQGYVSIEKWSQIFVSGTESARTENEEKAILVVKDPVNFFGGFSLISHCVSMLINDNLKTMKRLTIGGRAILIIEYLPNNLYSALPLSLSSIYLTKFKAIFS